MYILPGYVTYYEDKGIIYVTSKLHQNTIKLFEPDIVEEFWSVIRCGGCSEITTPLCGFLHEQEFLVNEEEIEKSIAELRKVMENSLFLTIMPTEGCNFRCSYCYEDHVPISMRRKTLDQIHAYIIEQAPCFRRINISWFGGEPTLCKDVILETSALMQSLQEKHHFQYTSSMTTNGYLLKCDDFKKYYHAGITAYQITLDGWDHDKTRPHVSGKGTLQTIIDNLVQISALSREEYQFHITIRHNILPGDEEYSWYDYLYSLFGNDNRFSMVVRSVCNWGGESVRSLKLLEGNSCKTLIRRHFEYLQSIGMQCGNEKKGPLSQICYASYPHSMVFRSNGKIEKCTVCLDHPKNCLGYVDSEKGVVLYDDINRLWTTSKLMPKCYHCSDILSCLNMQCPAHQIIHSADALECSDCPD